MNAALEEYAELGWSGFTIDGVARRAGVGKSTVYLRWSTKEELINQALREHDATLALGEDTGSLRGDLEDLVRRLLLRFREPAGWASYRAVLDAASHPEAHAVFPPEVGEDYLARGEHLLTRARDRGDLTLATNAATFLATIYGAVVQLLMTYRMQSEPITDEVVDGLTGDIVTLLLDRP